MQQRRNHVAEARNDLKSKGILPRPGIFAKLITGGMAIGPVAHSLIKINQLLVKRQELQIPRIAQRQQGQQVLIDKYFDQRNMHPKYCPAQQVKLFTTGSSSLQGIKEHENTLKIHASLDRLSASADENNIINTGYSVSKLCASIFVEKLLPYFITRACFNYCFNRELSSAYKEAEENIQMLERTLQQQLQQLNGK